jgi:DNA-binding NarL/FixJ family response regulator
MPESATVNVPLSVILIEDERTVREGLATLIDSAPDLRCVASFRSVEDTLAGLGSLRPAVILTDLRLPGISGIEGIRLLHEKFPDVPILALTVYDTDGQVFDALCAGASGYLLKNTPPDRLIESLRDVIKGGAPMSPEVARRVVRLFRTIKPPRRADYDLTPQENELLKLLVDGHHKKTAAHEMGISINTVSFHLKNIYGKLQVHSKSEAVVKALREHLI